MRLMVITMVAGTLGTVPKELEKGLEELNIKGRIKTIQTRTLLKSEYSEESWKSKETCCLSDSSERPPINAGVRN